MAPFAKIRQPGGIACGVVNGAGKERHPGRDVEDAEDVPRSRELVKSEKESQLFCKDTANHWAAGVTADSAEFLADANTQLKAGDGGLFAPRQRRCLFLRAVTIYQESGAVKAVVVEVPAP